MDVLIKIKICSENRGTRILIVGGGIGGLSLALGILPGKAVAKRKAPTRSTTCRSSTRAAIRMERSASGA
jgi:hypothetical protein